MGHVGHGGHVVDGIHVDGPVAVDEEVDNTVALAVDIVGAIDGAVALDTVGAVEIDEEVDNVVSVALVNPEQYWGWVGTAIASWIPHSHSPP